MEYKSLDAGALRNRVIDENIANATTPGYQRKEVVFEDELKKVFQKKIAGNADQPDQMPIPTGADVAKIQPQVVVPKDATLPGEINNVDIDKEMSKLAENQIQYDFSLRFVTYDNSQLQSAISGNPPQ